MINRNLFNITMTDSEKEQLKDLIQEELWAQDHYLRSARIRVVAFKRSKQGNLLFGVNFQPIDMIAEEMPKDCYDSLPNWRDYCLSQIKSLRGPASFVYGTYKAIKVFLADLRKVNAPGLVVNFIIQYEIQKHNGVMEIVRETEGPSNFLRFFLLTHGGENFVRDFMRDCPQAFALKYTGLYMEPLDLGDIERAKKLRVYIKTEEQSHIIALTGEYPIFKSVFEEWTIQTKPIERKKEKKKEKDHEYQSK